MKWLNQQVIVLYSRPTMDNRKDLQKDICVNFHDGFDSKEMYYYSGWHHIRTDVTYIKELSKF